MKRLACIAGRHDWKTVTEQGDEYKVCSRCGKAPKELTVEYYAEQQRLGEQHRRRKADSVSGPS